MFVIRSFTIQGNLIIALINYFIMQEYCHQVKSHDHILIMKRWQMFHLWNIVAQILSLFPRMQFELCCMDLCSTKRTANSLPNIGCVLQTKFPITSNIYYWGIRNHLRFTTTWIWSEIYELITCWFFLVCELLTISFNDKKMLYILQINICCQVPKLFILLFHHVSYHDIFNINANL